MEKVARLLLVGLLVVALLALACNWRELYWSLRDSDAILDASVNGRDPAAALAERQARARARAARRFGRELQRARELQVLGRIHAGRLRDRRPPRSGSRAPLPPGGAPEADPEAGQAAADLADFPRPAAGELELEAADAEFGLLLARVELLEGELEGVVPEALLAPISGFSRDAHEARRRAAVASARRLPPAARPREVLARMESHSSIPENVHDRGVVDGMTAKVRRLRAAHPPAAPAPGSAAILDAVAAYAAAAPLPPADCERALEALRRMREVRMHLVAFDAREDEVLGLVWARADLPANAGNAELIREAVVVALRDAWVRSEVSGAEELVCPNGRAERVVEALVLLDHDPVLRESCNTSENFKNEVYAAARGWFEAAVGRTELCARAYAEGAELDEVYAGAELERARAEEAGAREEVMRRVEARLKEIGGKLPRGLDERIRRDVEAALA